MNCVEASKLVHAYADGELDLLGNLGMEEHLRTCLACNAAVRQCQALSKALRGAGLAYSAPARLQKRVARAVRQEAGSRSHEGQVRFWQWLSLGAAVTAAVAIVFQPLSSLNRVRFEEEITASHIRSLMESHLTDVASTDRHTVKPWFSGRLDFTLPVEDFAAQGFDLVGGRLDYLRERTVAALVYRHNKHSINVFVWPSKTGDSRAKTTAYRGYSIVERDADGLHFCAISDMDSADLEKLLELIHK